MEATQSEGLSTGRSASATAAASEVRGDGLQGVFGGAVDVHVLKGEK